MMFELNYPLNMQVEVTENCNHKCFYCYNNWQTDNVINKNMTVEQSNNLVDIITKNIKPFHVTITGGEPLLNLDAVLALAKGLKKNNFFYNLNTNLILLTPDILEKLINVSMNGKFGILTSLPHYLKDNYENIVGAKTYDKFFNNLKYIKKHTDLMLSVNMVVHKKNLNSVYEEGLFLYENYGITNFAATPTIFPALSKSKDDYSLSTEEISKMLEIILKLQQDTGVNVDSLETIPRCLMPDDVKFNNLEIFNRACSAGRGTISIDYEGGVRACSHSPFVVDNIFETDFRLIWDKFKPFRENKFVPDECINCTEFYRCYGGCRFYHYQEGDKLNRKDPRMTKCLNFTAKKPSKSLPSINMQQKYKMNPNTLFRKEKDNLYTFFNGRFTNVLFLNEEFKNLLKYLSNQKEFSYIDLEKNLPNQQIKNKFKKLFQILIDRRYLI
jgi:radical SAM protein with 4Fe4S-binding SPASM domain